MGIDWKVHATSSSFDISFNPRIMILCPLYISEIIRLMSQFVDHVLWTQYDFVFRMIKSGANGQIYSWLIPHSLAQQIITVNKITFPRLLEYTKKDIINHAHSLRTELWKSNKIVIVIWQPEKTSHVINSKRYHQTVIRPCLDNFWGYLTK